AALQLLDLALEALLEGLDALVELLLQGLDLGRTLVGLDRDLTPLARRELAEDLVGDFGVGLQSLRAAGRDLIEQQLLQARVDVPLQDRLFVVTVLGQTLDFGALDGERTFVLIDATAGE